MTAFKKICPACNKSLPVGSFYKNKNRRDGLSWSCGLCISADKKSRYVYQVKPTKEETIAARIAYKAEWYKNNRKRVIERVVNRQRSILAKNPIARLQSALRSRVRQAIKHQRGIKAKKTMALTGCPIKELRERLESKFQQGMTWDNYGRGHGKWNIDHIIPVTAFDLSNPVEQAKCFHYSNLQPLWFWQNMAKGTTTPQSQSTSP